MDAVLRLLIYSMIFNNIEEISQLSQLLISLSNWNEQWCNCWCDDWVNILVYNEHWIERSRTWIYYSIVVILFFAHIWAFLFRLNTEIISFVLEVFYVLPSSKWTSDHPVKLVIFLTAPLYSGYRNGWISIGST